MDKQIRIGLLTAPLGRAGITQFSHLISILSSIFNNLYIISGDEENTNYFMTLPANIYTSLIQRKKSKNKLLRLIYDFTMQIKICHEVIKNNKNTDCWIRFGSTTLFLPLIVAKLFRKKIYTIIIGSYTPINKKNANYTLVSLAAHISLKTSDKIIVYSQNLIEEWNLSDYTSKIIIGHEHFLDFTLYKSKSLPSTRNEVIGYVGRFSEIKGVLKFIEAIPSLLENKSGLNFILIGDGELRSDIESFLIENQLEHHVELLNWVSHDELPNYLSKLKLLILPSYSEGLPNILLEAMACGTPVISTKVGSVPDIIVNGETGFIIDNNSQHSILKGINNALDCQKLDEISCNAQSFVKSEYSLSKTIDLWEKIVCDI